MVMNAWEVCTRTVRHKVQACNAITRAAGSLGALVRSKHATWVRPLNAELRIAKKVEAICSAKTTATKRRSESISRVKVSSGNCGDCIKNVVNGDQELVHYSLCDRASSAS